MPLNSASKANESHTIAFLGLQLSISVWPQPEVRFRQRLGVLRCEKATKSFVGGRGEKGAMYDNGDQEDKEIAKAQRQAAQQEEEMADEEDAPVMSGDQAVPDQLDSGALPI